MSNGTYTVRRTRNPFLGMNVTLQLLLLTVILFIVFSLLMAKEIISVDSVAIKPSNVFEGKYLWTFLTSIFMHAGVFHLFANMLSLLSLGSLVERLIGPKRYLLFYIFSGLFAGLLFVLSSLFLTSDAGLYAVGASGALFGLVGFLIIITPDLPLYVMFIPIPVKMKYAGPGILIILWLISVAGNIPIGNTAHLGGLVAGLIYGLYMRKKYRNKAKMISRYFS